MLDSVLSKHVFSLTCTGSQHGLLLNAETHLSHSLLGRLLKHLEPTPSSTETCRTRQAWRGARAILKQDWREVFHLWHCLLGKLNLLFTFA